MLVEEKERKKKKFQVSHICYLEPILLDRKKLFEATTTEWEQMPSNFRFGQLALQLKSPFLGGHHVWWYTILASGSCPSAATMALSVLRSCLPLTSDVTVLMSTESSEEAEICNATFTFLRKEQV